MPHTVNLSNSTQYVARLEVWDDLMPETRGPWFALYWANPNGDTGVRAHDNYLSFRTVKAAVKADKAHSKAVKRANGQSSYIPTSITAEDGRDISEEIERERMALSGW